MKKMIGALSVVALMIMCAGIGAVWANDGGIKSSKATAMVSELTLIDWAGTDDEEADYDSGWTDILEQNIKTANHKDLFIQVSLETGLYTKTHVKSKRNYEGDPNWDTSTAHAKIMVRVYVDTVDNPAYPREVVFNEREQELSAKFMGIFTGDCLIVTENEEGEHTVNINYSCLEPEELNLTLNTMSANAFNFVLADLDPGNHIICVQARIIANGAAEEGKFEAMGLVGQGSVLIESVRMIKGENYLELE
jgi:hypothetical protein